MQSSSTWFTFCPLEVNIYMSLHVSLGIQLTHISWGTGNECNSRSAGLKSLGLETIKESKIRPHSAYSPIVPEKKYLFSDCVCVVYFWVLCCVERQISFSRERFELLLEKMSFQPCSKSLDWLERLIGDWRDNWTLSPPKGQQHIKSQTSQTGK